MQIKNMPVSELRKGDRVYHGKRRGHVVKTSTFNDAIGEYVVVFTDGNLSTNQETQYYPASTRIDEVNRY